MVWIVEGAVSVISEVVSGSEVPHGPGYNAWFLYSVGRFVEGIAGSVPWFFFLL